MKIETQEQFDEFVGETIPQALFHIEKTDLDDEYGIRLDELTLLRILNENPEVLKFKSLTWFIRIFL
jgi:hypothetical protein